MVEILIKRSTVAGKAPTALKTGELAVNIPDKKIWIGDAAGAAALLFNAAAYLPLAGGTMTGTINVPNGINAINTASGFNIIGSAAGLTVRLNTTNLLAYGVNQIDAYKPIQLPADPVNNLHAATKQYVDNKLSTALLPTPTPTRLGGVFSGEAAVGDTMYGVDTSGAPIFKKIAVPYPTATTLGGVKSAGPNANQYVSGVDAFGALTFGDLPAASTPYVLPPPTASALGGVYYAAPKPGFAIAGIDVDGAVLYGALPADYTLPTASATVLGGVKVGANLSIDANGVLSATASGGTTYTLPIASAVTLGGIKIGNGLTIDANGVVTANAAGQYVNKTGDVMSGPLRFSPSSYSGGYNGTDAYLYMDTVLLRCIVPSGKQAWVADPQTGLVQFLAGVMPQCAYVPANANDLVNKTYADKMLPLAGGTMTGTIIMPTSVAGFQYGTTGYNVFGGSGGVAIRSNTTNLVTFASANVTYGVPMITPATGVGVQFGSAGATLSRGSAATKIAVNGMLELPTTVPVGQEAISKVYADGAYAPKVVVADMQSQIDALKAEIATLKGAA